MREEQHLGEEDKKKMSGLIERMMHPWLTDATCEINPLAGSLGIRRSNYSEQRKIKHALTGLKSTVLQCILQLTQLAGLSRTEM